MQSDRELLDAWVGGDESSGRRLVERYYTSVHRFLRAKVATEVEDLVQETFLALSRNRDGFREEATFRAYLFGTARNVLRTYYRRRKRKEGKLDFGSRSAVDLGTSPSAAVVAKSEKRLLLEGLRRIPVDDQIVVELFHWEELTAGEIADVLEIGERAVRSRLHRARERLAEAVKKIAASPELLESTLGNLEGWAARARELAIGEQALDDAR